MFYSEETYEAAKAPAANGPFWGRGGPVEKMTLEIILTVKFADIEKVDGKHSFHYPAAKDWNFKNRNF